MFYLFVLVVRNPICTFDVIGLVGVKGDCLYLIKLVEDMLKYLQSALEMEATGKTGAVNVFRSQRSNPSKENINLNQIESYKILMISCPHWKCVSLRNYTSR